MTTPGGGGSANLGTVTGRVRINYESSNVRAAVRDVESLQGALSDIGSTAGRSARDVDRATGVFGQFGRMLDRLGQKVIPNPAQGLGTRVETETGRATKALAQLQRSAGNTNVKTNIKVTAGRVELDHRSIEGALRNAARLPTLTVTAPIKLAPNSVTLEQRAIENAVRSARMTPMTLRVPVRVEPTDVQVNTGSLTQAVNAAGGAAGGGAAGLASVAPMLGRIAAVGGVATAAVGGLALTLGRGFARLNSIDQATVKLAALGQSAASIQQISTSALDSVQGTAYGLEEAFATAADAINAGIKPGEQLDKYLQATANTAALAGVGMQDLGSAFAQAAVTGKLTGDVMQTLYSRQVPVLKLLGDEYDVSQQKAQEMVSNGEVSFDRFMNAMSQTGGAAKAMGNTIGGSFNNLKAAVGRLGANLLAPLFGKENADDAGVIASAIQTVTGWVDKLGKMVKSNASGIVTFFEGLAKGALTVGKVFTTLVSVISDAMVKIVEIVGDTTGWLSRAFATVADLVGADGVAENVNNFADSMHNLGAGLRETRDTNMGKLNRTLDNLWESTGKWADKAREAANGTKNLKGEAGATAPVMLSLAEALDKLQIKAETAEQALMGTNAQFKEFLEQVKDKGGTEDLIKQLTEVRSRFENGGRQVKNFADAIDNMSDATASASDKASKLIDALQGLGLLPGGDALASYNEAFEEMTSYMSTIIDLADTTGNALANVDGTLNLNSQNGRNLLQQISSIRQEMVALAASGEATPDEAYARTVEGLNQLLTGQAGISPEVAQKIIDTYLPKGAILDSLKAQNPTQALESIFQEDPAKLDTMLNLLTTTQDILGKIVGPDGKLHIPTVVDTPGTPGSAAPGTPGGPLGPPLPPAPGDKPQPPAVVGPPNPAPGDALPPQARGALAPTDLGGLLGAPAGGTDADKLVQLANNQEKFAKALAENPEIANQLQALVDQANAQGQNMGVALAQGLISATPEVRDALLKLAGMAGDYLGNSPAKYGPLSGKGWTEYRGKTFTQDWAKGIASEAGTAAAATETVAGAAAGGVGGGSMTLSDSITGMLKDLQEFSDLGKMFLDFGNQIADIGFGFASTLNDLSGGALFPKSYTKVPGAKTGSVLPDWSPLGNRAAVPGLNGFPNQPGPLNSTPSVAAIAPNAKGDAVAKNFIDQAKAAGFSDEQILAGLGVLNQETAYGTNPRTNDVQNQNGTAGITGVFQQDMSYRKYGDPRDPNNAIKGFIDQFVKTGDGLNDPNPWRQALDVQRPALVGSGGYDDRRSSDPGGYLRDRQRAQALEVYNRLSGSGQVPPLTSAASAGGNFYTDWYPKGGSNTHATGDGHDHGTPMPTTLPAGGSQNTNGAIGYLEQIARDQFGLTLTSGKREWAGTASGKSYHLSGEAGDFAIPGVNVPTENKRKFAEYVRANLSQYVSELIYSDDDGWSGNLVDGQPHNYGAKTLGEHRNHVHVAIKDSMQEALANGSLPSTLPPAFASQGGQQAVPVAITGSANTALTNIWQNTNGMPSMPGQLQALVDGNPILQNAMANQAGLTSETVVPVLQELDKQIAMQNKLGTADSKALSTALGGYKSNLQSQFGLQEGPSSLETAQTMVSGVSGMVGSAFELFDQGLKTIGATHDIATTLVRGIENTADVNKLIDRGQEFITLFQKGFQLASDVTSFASQIAGASGGMDGGAASGGLAAASALTGLISQGLAAANTAIDIGQEVYAITTKYVGRFIQSWTGLTGASDVRYLLDEYTGQVQAYSSDNPQQRSIFNTLGRQLQGEQAYQGRPPVTNYNTVYQGPGQDPRDTMDDMMFSVRASGMGAFGSEL